MSENKNTYPQSKYASVKSLAERYSVSAPTIWRWSSTGNFPKPEQLSGGCSRWDLEKVRSWEAERQTQRSSRSRKTGTKP